MVSRHQFPSLLGFRSFLSVELMFRSFFRSKRRPVSAGGWMVGVVF
jgi:hypothetical protein